MPTASSIAVKNTRGFRSAGTVFGTGLSWPVLTGSGLNRVLASGSQELVEVDAEAVRGY